MRTRPIRIAGMSKAVCVTAVLVFLAGWTVPAQAEENILYVMNNGCQWKSLPRRMGAGSTIHRRFQEWRAAGVFDKIRQEGILVEA